MRAIPRTALLSALILTPSICSVAAVTVPQSIKVQGDLADAASGTPVPAHGSYDMTFTLWSAMVGGELVASAGPLAVEVLEGRFDVEVPFGTARFQGPERYLEIAVAGEALSPRIKLASTPFALVADRSASAESADLALSVAAGVIGPANLAYFCSDGETIVRNVNGWSCAVLDKIVCPWGSFLGCYTGPPSTRNVGECRAGTSACNAAGTGFEACADQALPTFDLCDGKDNDCDGEADENGICSCVDADGDGFPSAACGGNDCQDTNAVVHPGAVEACDGLDGDCDGTVPTSEWDLDGDGYSACAGDCLDFRADIHPGAPDICDNIDNDCDPGTPDGWAQPIGQPCDGTDPDSIPQGVFTCCRAALRCTDDVEACNGIDDDCDGAVDEGCP